MTAAACRLDRSSGPIDRFSAPVEHDQTEGIGTLYEKRQYGPDVRVRNPEDGSPVQKVVDQGAVTPDRLVDLIVGYRA